MGQNSAGIWLRWLMVGIMLGACNFPTVASLTATALHQATLTPSPARPTPRPTASPTPAPTGTPTPPCLQARVHASPQATVQVPAQATLQPQRLVTSTGSCPWQQPPQIVAKGSVPFVWEAQVQGPQPVAPQGRVQIHIQIQAPSTPGRYTGAWQMQTTDGRPIPLQGTQDALTLQLQVLAPTPTPTWAAPVFLERRITLREGHTTNLDDGQGDLIYQVSSDTDQWLAHRGMVAFYQIYVWPPDFGTCKNVHFDYNFDGIKNPHMKIGTAYCYITNERRIGAFKITNAYKYDGKWHLELHFVTWDYRK